MTAPSVPRRVMLALEVFANEDLTITIKQPSSLSDEDDGYVNVHPDQVELLIEWLRKVRDEISEINENNRGS
jgi:hypothetical protein